MANGSCQTVHYGLLVFVDMAVGMGDAVGVHIGVIVFVGMGVFVLVLMFVMVCHIAHLLFAVFDIIPLFCSCCKPLWGIFSENKCFDKLTLCRYNKEKMK